MNLCDKAPLSPELEAKVLEPYTYLVRHCQTLKSYSKHMFPKFAMALNHWLNIPQDKLEMISSLIEMLKNACLLLDDIEDNSRLRGGLPVAHHVYGIPLTINAANSVYFLAIEKLLDDFPKESRADGVRILTEQWLQMHRGTGVEIYWRDAFICPSEEEYLEMIQRKTSSFIVMFVRLMQLFSDDKRDFGNLLKLLTMYLQIANDYNNVKSKKYEEYKSFAEDLTEGKFSFPIIHAIRNSPNDKSLFNILKQRTENVHLKKYAVSRLEKSGSLAYTHKVMNEVYEKIIDEIENLGGNPLLKCFCEYMKEKPF